MDLINLSHFGYCFLFTVELRSHFLRKQFTFIYIDQSEDQIN